jgi:hypothetical protein
MSTAKRSRYIPGTYVFLPVEQGFSNKTHSWTSYGQTLLVSIQSNPRRPAVFDDENLNGKDCTRVIGHAPYRFSPSWFLGLGVALVPLSLYDCRIHPIFRWRLA